MNHVQIAGIGALRSAPCTCILLSLLLLLFRSGHSAVPDCAPVAPILSGYGANGSYDLAKARFYSPRSTGDSAWFYHPAGVVKPMPVILFCHGLGAVDPAAYLPLIRNLVSRGCCVVYPPFLVNQTDPSLEQTYQVLLAGLDSARAAFGPLIDTTRVGIVGHSFGAGAGPWLGRQIFGERKWGGRGACMHLMAPWYSFMVTDDELASFPRRVNLVMEVFADDAVNDHRMAVDVFTHIGLPDSQKVFIILNSDSCGQFRQEANHSVPTAPPDEGAVEDGLDYYGVFRVADALVACTFHGDRAARRLLFGPVSAALVDMGRWANGRPVRPLTATRAPAASRPSTSYLTSWDYPINPRNPESTVYKAEEMKRRLKSMGQSMGEFWLEELRKMGKVPGSGTGQSRPQAPAPSETAYDTL